MSLESMESSGMPLSFLVSLWKTGVIIKTVMGFAKHYQSGETLPDELFLKLTAARTYRAGSQMLRQLMFGLLDMNLHDGFDPKGQQSIFALQKKVAETASVLPVLDEDRFLCSFSHILPGGYSAGYYSYKWAEVLSADAFAAFEEAGLEDDDAMRQIGLKFRDTVLALGGSQHPMDVFKEYRGRELQKNRCFIKAIWFDVVYLLVLYVFYFCS